MNKCYRTINETVISNSAVRPDVTAKKRIAGGNVLVELPVRINFGGGWSDTPPVCMEHGGTVLNAAVKLDGRYPVRAVMKKTDSRTVVLSCADNNSYEEFTDMKKLASFGDPNDSFALHKAALCSCGIIRPGDTRTVRELTEEIGGGFILSTDVINIPRGSGLGTSSILSAACVKAIYRFFGMDITDGICCSEVLNIEQIMSTGGGWQDQAGAVTGGFKTVSSSEGLCQNVRFNELPLSDTFVRQLEKRLCLIYSGQRRLARNLLRDIIGKYLASDPAVLYAVNEVRNISVLMRYELERENIDGFARLMDRHWELSKMIDSGCTNTGIDQIFASVEDLIDGRMVCGAGGGGFLQVVLKKGVTAEDLSDRISSVFEDAGPKVWNYSFDV